MTTFDEVKHLERAPACRPRLRRTAVRLFGAAAASTLALGFLADDASADRRGYHYPPREENELPFKVAKIYFETNASACDMGIQIVFDTEGITKGIFKDPNDRVLHTVAAQNGLRRIGGQTEGFLESVEPVISDLVAANSDCTPDPDEPTISLDNLRRLFPAGNYEFEGVTRDGTEFDDDDELTYCVPDGPKLLPPDGKDDVDATEPLEIGWQAVTRTIPGVPDGCRDGLKIVGYQVLVYDADAGEAPQEFNVTVPGGQTSVTVPTQFLQPDANYKLEVLAIEASGNQTITEGEFSTRE